MILLYFGAEFKGIVYRQSTGLQIARNYIKFMFFFFLLLKLKQRKQHM